MRDLFLGKTERIDFNAFRQAEFTILQDPSISSDGRYVVFSSYPFLNTDDGQPESIYLKDRQTGELTRISQSFSGDIPNGDSGHPRVSANGRYVVYSSSASNIVTDDPNPERDIFLYDIQNKTTEIVSISSTNVPGDGESSSPAINDDGSMIVFVSKSSNLVETEVNGFAQIYLRDRTNSKTHLVSVSNEGLFSNKDCSSPATSDDGRFVVYESKGTNLVPGADNAFEKVFLRDMKDGLTELVSFTDSGDQADQDSSMPSISSDGRFIAFTSTATNILNSEPIPARNSYRWDRLTNTREIIGRNRQEINSRYDTNDGIMSRDGQYLVFTSEVKNGFFINPIQDVYVVNLGRIRPNAMISKWEENVFSGAGIIDPDRSQRESQKIMPGETAVYKIRIVNQGVDSDQLKITSGMSKTGWNERFFDMGADGRNITKEIVSDGWITPSLNPAEFIEIKLEVTANNDSQILRSNETLVIVSVANGKSAVIDSVSAVTAVPRSLPGSFLISRSTTGVPGNGDSTDALLSADGRFATFTSEANNLVPNDFNTQVDVFRYDREAHLVSRVSETRSGKGGNSPSTNPSISRDGFRVAFHSRSGNLISEPRNFRDHIYLRDFTNNTLTRITAIPGRNGSIEANRGSQNPRLSGNGKLVLFESVATNLGPADNNGVWDLYLHDIENKSFEMVSRSGKGKLGNGDSTNGHIPFNGRYIVFDSFATNLALGDDNVYKDVYFIDRNDNLVEIISTSFDGKAANGPSIANGISDDGRFILFSSYASNIVEDDTNGELDLFLHDRSAGKTMPINTESRVATGSVGSISGSIRPDGEWITFSSIANNLNPEYSSVFTNVVLYHVESGEMSVISLTNLGKQANGSNFLSQFSADGRYLTFLTQSSDLTGERIGKRQVMLYDMAEFQPDILVAGGVNAPFRGEGLFEPEDQKVHQLISLGDTKVFKIRVENNSTFADRLVVTGAKPEDGSYSVLYFSGNLDITDSVSDEGWTTKHLTPGEGEEIEIHIKENTPTNVERSLLLRVHSATDVFKSDQAIAVVETDQDKDGMSDTWEESFWGTTTDAKADTDHDNDGVFDFQEFIAGTDPMEADSRPVLTIDKTPGKGTFTLRWPSKPDRFYTLQRATTANGTFSNLTEQVRGIPPENSYEDLDSESRDKSFYRLHIERP